MHRICLIFVNFACDKTLSNRVQIGVHVTGSFASHLLGTMESRERNLLTMEITMESTNI